jgi:hypothetical protein
MTGPWSRRASALLLALIFVSGSLGFSTADALAYHRAGANRGLWQPHYEPAGSTCGHADRCVLRATIPGPRVVTPLSLLGRLAPVLADDAFLPPVPSLPGALRHPLAQPRAPPLPAA